jgi:hypothetical protein
MRGYSIGVFSRERSAIRRQVLQCFAVILLVVGATASLMAAPPEDVRATAVVDQMMDAMGGPAAWAKVHYLRFDWVVERDGKTAAYVRHLWDRYEGRYRVEWKSREGKSLVALFNVNTRTGRVYVNGQPARDEDEQKYLDEAYGRFINDSYWLLMPWKLKDAGVNLTYRGEAKMDGQPCDMIEVSFENVGLTPGDHYWAYINRRTHMMDRWAYFLQSYEGTPSREKATPWDWRDWRTVGGIWLATDKVRVGENMRIHFPVLMAPSQVDARVFESLDASMPGPAPAKE